MMMGCAVALSQAELSRAVLVQLYCNVAACRNTCPQGSLGSFITISRQQEGGGASRASARPEPLSGVGSGGRASRHQP